MSNRTIPPPNEHDRELAELWVAWQSVDAIAQLRAEVRWLREIVHNHDNSTRGNDDE